MADQGELYEKSWILHHILDGFIGSRELVAVRRRLTVVKEDMEKCKKMPPVQFFTGSSSEGMKMQGSDIDMMMIDTYVIVTCPDQQTSIPPGSTDKTVLMMRDAASRPGYVTLELLRLGEIYSIHLKRSIVPVGDVHFISSEMYTQFYSDFGSNILQINLETHGPATTMRSGHSNYPIDFDHVFSFPCYHWPREASEWVSRPRLHGWPDKALRDQIAQGGCHLVPVGDKTSADMFLQWRISFTTAERKLIHSLTHIQFLVYGLLKYFLKQISGMMQLILGDTDIISSYIIKTIIFYAVETTPDSLWQEKHTFLCFMLCFKILIAWVNVGYCPNYFINSNNMFLGKVQGENQQKLLRFLIDLHDMKWECLSVGTFIQPSIGECVQAMHNFKSVQNAAWDGSLLTPAQSERTRDMQIFQKTITSISSSDKLPVSLALLSKSQTDMDEFIAYFITVEALSIAGTEAFSEHSAVRGNKGKYKALRKCKKLLTPLASACTTGLLKLATYCYQTGNYRKSLEMCGHMISSFKLYVGGSKKKDIDRYEHLYCGRGYTLLQKCQEACVSNIVFTKTGLQFWPSQIKQEITKMGLFEVPPLPYAMFLSFLCYHELGDTRRRDTTLIDLRAVKYDSDQGCGIYWAVHNLLATCYEMVGDTQRALRECRDSLRVLRYDHVYNPAMERIERIQQST